MSRITEREVAAEISRYLNDLIKEGGYPFDSATVEHKGGRYYPDIVIWEEEYKKAFAIWELKIPGKHEDMKKLVKKLAELNAKFAVVWNFQSGELYEVVNGKLEHRKSYPTYILGDIQEWRIKTKQQAVFREARKILDDLRRLYEGRSLTPYTPDKIYFIGILSKAINNLIDPLHKYITENLQNKKVRDKINAWVVKQGYALGQIDYEKLIARHWAYALAVRILFYFTIRRYHPDLPDLSGNTTWGDLLKAFRIAQSIDWQAVFEPSPLDGLGIPKEAHEVIKELLSDFTKYDFSTVKEDVIGEIMESLIPEEERHNLGQYFTREDLVDFIIGFVADKEEANYLDPTCGTGTFLNRLYDRIKVLSNFRRKHEEILEQLWGIDIAHFPAELATINLFRLDPKNISNFPHVAVKDFFDVMPGDVFEFPPPKAAKSGYKKVKIPIPIFYGIVGNFPYIRQELIEKHVKGYKKKIVKAIAKNWLIKDPFLFKIKGKKIDPKQLEMMNGAALKRLLDNGDVELKLSGQADIYAYLFYHAGAFLEEGGRMGIVTSNSWLDTAYGEWLKWFFLRHFKIVAVVSSWAEPWFHDASVNTAFVILERCSNEKERKDNFVKFVKVKKPLSEILPQNLGIDMFSRWRKIDAIVREIENSHLYGKAYENEVFRIRAIKQEELQEEIKRKGKNSKWGLYLRAPQVYFDIVDKMRGKLIPLKKIAPIRRGYTTGINEFFYLQIEGKGSQEHTVRAKNDRGWVGEIEKGVLKLAIKSPKEVEGIVVEPSNLKYYIFLPPIPENVKDPERFLEATYPLAYRYVKWGEKQRTKNETLWPQVSTVRNRKAWWLLPYKEPAPILLPMLNDKRFVIFINGAKAIADHTLFEFMVDKDVDIIAALMNSTLFALIREVGSRATLGDGATRTDGIDWKNNIYLPDLSTISQRYITKILKSFKNLQRRPIYPIHKELKQKDRRAFDKVVLEAVGLDPDVYLPKIYEGLLEMVDDRLRLPKMRKKLKKSVQKMSRDQLKTKIKEEVIPKGLKPIYTFLPKNIKTDSYPISGRVVRYKRFFNKFHLIDENGNDVGEIEGTENKAKYIIYASRPGIYTVEIPVDEAVVGKVIQEYERYLKEEGRKLYKICIEYTKDHKEAESVAREILKELGLPPLAIEVAMDTDT